MPADQIVNVTITRQTALPSRAGFETVLLAAYHTLVTDRVVSVSSLAGAEALGFTAVATPAINRALTVMFSQSPRPSSIKIGKRLLPSTQTVTVTPLAAQGTGFVWTLVIDGESVTYTEEAADTVTDIVTGLTAAVTAAALGLTPSGTTSLTLTGVAGVVHAIYADPRYYTLAETTANPGVATDLSEIRAADSDWYGLVLDSQSPLELAAAAGWAEARTVLLAGDVYTSDVTDSGSSTDPGSVLETALRERTFTVWTNQRIGAYYAAGRLAGHLAEYDPGEATWAFKRIRGVDTYTINTTDQGDLEAKQVNYLASVGGVFVMLPGKVASGEWIDVIRTIDWMTARIREEILAILLANPKLPYTDGSIALVTSAISVFLQNAVTSQVLADDPAPTVTAPRAIDVSASDRAARLLPDIEFAARIAGAVHTVDIAGSIQV